MRLALVSTKGTYAFHKDYLGSTLAVSDSTGAKVEETRYLPFGAQADHTGTTVTEYKFTDQELDPEVGLYNYGARLYDPVIGRFVSADTTVPDQFDPQSFNRYSYCLNNPLIYVDPNGHYPSSGWDNYGDGIEKNPTSENYGLHTEGGVANKAEKDYIVDYVCNPAMRMRHTERIDRFIRIMKYKNARLWPDSPEEQRFRNYVFLLASVVPVERLLSGVVAGAKYFKISKRFSRIFRGASTVRAKSFWNKTKNIFNKLIGKDYPTKLNRGAKLQPYDPVTGRFLSYNANPGLKMSPISRFSAGFAQGWAEAKGAGVATPVGKAGNLGHMIGNTIGNLF